MAAEFAEAFGRDSGGLLHGYRIDDAETVVVALGSVLGTIKDAVDAPRETGERVGVARDHHLPPLPAEAVRAALAGAVRSSSSRRRSASGFGGVLSTDVAMATHDADRRRTVIAGLGGRPSPWPSSRRCSSTRRPRRLDAVTFLDLDHALVDARARPHGRRRAARALRPRTCSRDLGTVAPGRVRGA